MSNLRLSKIFNEIADFLEAEEVDFKPRAYRRAARSIKDLDVEVEIIYEEKGKEGLKEIPDIGESIAQKIIEFLETGEIEYLKNLKEKAPFKVEELTRVEGLGPKGAKKLFKKLDVRSLKDLKKAVEKGDIAELEGFGEKSQENIAQAIEFLEHSKGRFLLGEVLPQVERLKKKMSRLSQISKMEVAGSVRRMKKTIGDVDLLVVVQGGKKSKKAQEVMEFFTGMPEVVKVWSKGSTRSSVRLQEGINVDLRIVSPSSFGSALQYFTGSKEHNIAVRGVAKNKGMKLNEYGLFKDEKNIAGKKEEEIYEKLGMSYIPPELRENRGEVQSGLKGNLPDLIKKRDLKGDLHMHSDWNGGKHSISEMAKVLKSMGYKYGGISDHTKFLKVENGLDEEKLLRQKKEIKRINRGFKKTGFVLLQGCEANILKDGSLDMGREILSEMDYVIAGVHSHFHMGKKEITDRLIKALQNPEVNIISHPTGRVLKRRKEFDINWDRFLGAVQKNKVALEINSSAARLDLDGEMVKRVKETGVKMVIGSDSHAKVHLSGIRLGVGQARRGWAEKKDIINSWELEDLLSFFSKT